MKRSRTEILAAVLLAFSTGTVDGAGLTAAEWEWAETEIETRYAVRGRLRRRGRGPAERDGRVLSRLQGEQQGRAPPG